MIKNTQLVVLSGFLTCYLFGCTVTNDLYEGGSTKPDGWSTAVADSPDRCVPIDGSYQTFGVGRSGTNDGMVRVRLDAALGRVFPSDKIPEQVTLSLDQKSGMLNIHFGLPVNQGFSTPANCLNGWYLFEERLTNQYLGDGTTLDYSISKIELGKSVDGDLILHLFLDIQSSSLLIFRSRDIEESWSKFEQVDSENQQSLRTKK